MFIVVPFVLIALSRCGHREVDRDEHLFGAFQTDYLFRLKNAFIVILYPSLKNMVWQSQTKPNQDARPTQSSLVQ